MKKKKDFLLRSVLYVQPYRLDYAMLLAHDSNWNSDIQSILHYAVPKI